MKITQKEIELIGEYAPSEGVIESDGICFTDEMIIDFAKQYHQEQLKLLNIDNVRLCFYCKEPLRSDEVGINIRVKYKELTCRKCYKA